jgi:hypothetical protein
MKKLLQKSCELAGKTPAIFLIFFEWNFLNLSIEEDKKHLILRLNLKRLIANSNVADIHQ